MTPRILIVGGAGAFGRRLVEGILATTGANVIVGGRTQRSANLVQDLRVRYGRERVETVALDRDSAEGFLRRQRPFCVVDAAGPFQDADPHLARAAIATGCHFVDLADARDFVARFGILDAQARAAGILAATGASSTPALSGAVLERLVGDWRHVERVEIAISPGNRAPRGRSVVTAILAYAGRPVRVWIDGRWVTRPGWGDLVRRRMPGVGARWLSLCETPDLDLVPARYPSARTVVFRAGLELSVLHLGLWLMAMPVRLRMARSLRRLAPALHRVAGWFEGFGSDRGGMMVEAEGIDAAGRETVATWSLVAQAGDGPNVPVLPALALIRALLDGRMTVRGARPASGLLSLETIELEFKRFRIETRSDVRWPLAQSLFERVLGPRIESLPSIVRDVHTRADVSLSGRVTTEGAVQPVARAVARLVGFPASLADAPAWVRLTRRGAGEVWTRRFGLSAFRSTMHADAASAHLHERFGPLVFALRITADASGFTLAANGWRCGPVALPLWLGPRISANTSADEKNRYHFDVSIALPWIGRLIRCRGWLSPDEA